MFVNEVELQDEEEAESPLLSDNDLGNFVDNGFTGYNDGEILDVSYISDHNNFEDKNKTNEENLEKDFFRMCIVALKLVFTEDHEVDYLGDIDPEEL